MPLFYLEELAKTKIHKHCTLKEAYMTIGTAYIVQKRLGIRRNTDVQRNA
jgi:hypothetical protein